LHLALEYQTLVLSNLKQQHKTKLDDMHLPGPVRIALIGQVQLVWT